MKKIIFSVLSLILLFSLSVSVGAVAQKSTFIDMVQNNENRFSVAQCRSFSFNDGNGILSGVADAKSETDNTSDPCIFFNTTYVVGKNTEFHFRMRHETTQPETTYVSIYFQGTKADGTAIQYSEASRYNLTIPATSSGIYMTYIVPVDTSVYEDATISGIRFDPIGHKGSFDIDYFMITEGGDDFVWDFQTDGNHEGWWCQVSGATEVKDGLLKYEAADTYEAAFMWSSPKIDADTIIGAEVIMKYSVDSDATSAASGIYYSGTNAQGDTFTKSEASASKITLSKSSNDQFVYLYYDFEGCTNWAGSSITSITYQVMKDKGGYEIDRIRYLYDPNMYSPLDPSDMSLSYTFDEENAGSANGTISIDFAGQPLTDAKNVRLAWASKNENGVYSDLEGYSVIKAVSGENLTDGSYVISKGLIIPEGANALSAHITDTEKTFTLNFDLPLNKIPTYEEPLYTAVFASEFHFGWWGTENGNPLPVHEKVLSYVNDVADFMVVVGDSTQWNGATEKEFEWDAAENYFKRYTIPLYMVRGNHELPTKYPLEEGFSDQYFKEFFNNWISYSEDNEFYSEEIERVSDSLYYYDTEINDHHYIFLQIPFTGNYSGFGDDQLTWLDNKLFEKEQSGKPIFVFGHFPLRNTIGNLESSFSNQIIDHARFREILDKHPTAIYVSGHTHFSLYNDGPSVIDGKLSSPSFINDGGIISQEIIQPDGSTSVGYDNAMGVVVEVCEDRIIVKGRDFSNDKWISQSLHQITLAGSTSIEGLTATRKFDGENTVLTAKVSSGDVSSYTWYADGAVLGTGKTFTVAGETDAVISVRARDASGYASAVAEEDTGLFEAPYVLGAQIRIPGDKYSKVTQGLRFISTISADTYNQLKELNLLPKTNDDTGVGFGTVIVPEILIPEGEKLTKETPMAYTVPAVKIYAKSETTVQYTVCLTDLLEGDYEIRYAVVPYITYMDGDQEVTVYGEQYSTTVYDVAKYACAPESDESEFVKDYLQTNVIDVVEWTGIYRP